MDRSLTYRLAQAAGCLSPPLNRLLCPYFSSLENKVQEIRLRVARPAAVDCEDETLFLTKSGGLTDLPCGDLYITTRTDIDDTFQRACDFSVYARQREIQNGYVTLRGGHRVGVCGTAVNEGDRILNVRDITSLCIRVAREHIGCGEELFRRLKDSIGGVLICGAPCSGKTTLLRDLARLFSTAEAQNVSLIDERGELAAVSGGEPQNDVGFCDIYSGYPKAQAVEQALRCMAPQLIICDEIGSQADEVAIKGCVNCGVRVIAAAHASSREELYSRPAMKSILSTGAFGTVVFLRGRDHAGEIAFSEQTEERLAA